jgi:hypothetical protein
MSKYSVMYLSALLNTAGSTRECPGMCESEPGRPHLSPRGIQDSVNQWYNPFWVSMRHYINENNYYLMFRTACHQAGWKSLLILFFINIMHHRDSERIVHWFIPYPAPGNSQLLLGTLDCSWALSIALGHSRTLLGTLGRSWALSDTLGHSRTLPHAPGSI